jgi:hypothetical protein
MDAFVRDFRKGNTLSDAMEGLGTEEGNKEFPFNLP